MLKQVKRWFAVVGRCVAKPEMKPYEPKNNKKSIKKLIRNSCRRLWESLICMVVDRNMRLSERSLYVITRTFGGIYKRTVTETSETFRIKRLIKASESGFD